tara:strand:- start:42622 stop:42822 length:201 start_codon:yes stop_codon:yes gene_type:complete
MFDEAWATISLKAFSHNPTKAIWAMPTVFTWVFFFVMIYPRVAPAYAVLPWVIHMCPFQGHISEYV